MRNSPQGELSMSGNVPVWKCHILGEIPQEKMSQESLDKVSMAGNLQEEIVHWGNCPWENFLGKVIHRQTGKSVLWKITQLI